MTPLIPGDPRLLRKKYPNGRSKAPPQISPRSHLLCSPLTGLGRKGCGSCCGRGGLVDFSVSAWDACWTLGREKLELGADKKSNPCLPFCPRAISEACFRLLTGWHGHHDWGQFSTTPLQWSKTLCGNTIIGLSKPWILDIHHNTREQ